MPKNCPVHAHPRWRVSGRRTRRISGRRADARHERDHLALRLQALSPLARDRVFWRAAPTALLTNVDLGDELVSLAKSFDSERAVGCLLRSIARKAR
jgi:hypothetical protein